MDKNKQLIEQLRDEAANRARVLYDQMGTLETQLEEVKVELERTRGDFRAFSYMLDNWQDSNLMGQPSEEPSSGSLPGEVGTESSVDMKKSSARKSKEEA